MCGTSKSDISPIKPHVTHISFKNKKKRSEKTLNRVKFSHVPFSFKQIKKGKNEMFLALFNLRKISI